MNITISPVSTLSFGNGAAKKLLRQEEIEYLSEMARQKWNWDHPMQQVHKSHASQEVQEAVKSRLRAKRILENIRRG